MHSHHNRPGKSTRRTTTLRLIFCLAILTAATGCSTLISSATSNIADGLSDSVLNSNDLHTVERGLPAYILLLDGLLADDPQNTSMLLAAANLNSAYAGIFATDPDQRKTLSNKALDYARRALCRHKKDACGVTGEKFSQFEQAVKNFKLSDIDYLYTLGATWAGWIEANSDDWNAIAQISRVQTIMAQVLTLDENHESGSAHLYLGTLATIIPPAMGGKPEVGRKHFEKAIHLSSGQNLMAKVIYARRYARLLFERDLHDRLLQEVISSEPDAEGLTLINVLAKRQAQELLDDADEYF